MSAYGPALFVSRRDRAELSEEEQARVFELVRAACLSVGVTGDDGEPAKPSIYGYDQEEQRALGVLLYSSYAYVQMPDEIREDHEEGWRRVGARVAAEIEKQSPGVYAFASYGVEN
ncbi:hypothetical protein F4553_001739 [Allocatelliglobosispora scoriae]|uniref:Uncharacterized protein n=1 Tax=Allocatelliglobosispora scoriae TaxID=643052 RepID=A0A841BNH7_9ACTN|nr:hypothetical protein [Allocatelliglobosispora scoriae]MBB5868360.1 hypothetical protein [Allocatelliglobosispora scoriae]